MMMLGGGLFALGGTKGKYWRRFVLPLFLALGCVLSHITWWQASIYAILLCVALIQGYGEKASYFKKFIIFCAYSGCSAVIGLSWWLLIAPVVLILSFAASNWKPLASTFFWKAAEFLMGTLIAISLIAAVNNKYV
jgi:hypothetical protein